MSPRESRHVVRFGTFEFDPGTGELTRQGRRVPLQEKPARVLALLLQHPGELVTRDELRSALWPADTFVEFETGLNVAVMKVREALGDAAASPRFVERVPKRGYRFIADLHTKQPFGPLPVATPSVQAPPASNSASGLRIAKPSAIVGLVSLAAALVAWSLVPAGRPALRAELPASITVLPFAVAPDADLEEYFGRNLADVVAQRLGRLKRTSIRRWSGYAPSGSYAGDAAAARQLLGVDALVAGEIRRSGDRLVVHVAVVATHDGLTIWEDTFDVRLAEAPWLETIVGGRLTEAFVPSLGDDQRAMVGRRQTESMEAHRSYLEGRYFFERRSEADLHRAAAAFSRAIEIDPAYADAYAWLANCYGPLAGLGYMASWDAGARQEAAASRAVELDPENGMALLNLAAIPAMTKWRWQEADALFQHALAIDPDSALGHHWYAFYLQMVRRFGDAHRERRRALELDPRSLMFNVGLAELLLAEGRAAESVAQSRQTLELNPKFFYAQWVLGQAYAGLGRHEEAVVALRAAAAAADDTAAVQVSLGRALARTGQTAEAREILERLSSTAKRRFVPLADLALLHLALGERAEALHLLETACDRRDFRLPIVAVRTDGVPFAIDAPFRRVLGCVGLPLTETASAAPAASSPVRTHTPAR